MSRTKVTSTPLPAPPECTHTHTCMCDAPLQHADMDPFLGDFCLEDKIFPGTYGDSLLFKESNLAKLKKKDIHVPSYTVEKTEPTTSKGSRHESDSTKEGKSTSSHRAEESHKAKETCKIEQSHKISGQTSMASLPQFPNSTSGKNSSKERQTPTAKEKPDYCKSEESQTSRHKERSCHEKSERSEPDKEGGSSVCKWGDHHLLALVLWGISPRNPTLKHLPFP